MAWGVRRREVYLENLKVVAIAVIIALHGLLSYAGSFDVWWYTEVREVSLSAVTEAVLFVVVGPFGLLVIPLLFLVAGQLTVPSLERRGAAAYVRSRLLRLGVPFVVYVVLVQPPVVYALEHRLGVASGSYVREFLGEPAQLDMGPLWFVGVLLIFSLLYVAWVAVRPRRRAAREVTVVSLWVLAAAVAPATYGIRLLFRIGDEGLVSGLNFWEWPACAAMFAVGIVGSRQGWLVAVPERIVRHSRMATFASAGALVVVMTAGAGVGAVGEENWRGGPSWVALAFATLGSPLTVFGPVWLLGLAQRHLNRRLRWIGPVAARSAYGAFIVQVVVLIGLAVALRPVPAPAELKALVVASAGIAGSFALAWLLIRWVPGLHRVL
ncbi:MULTISPECIES: acyltransferase family protein [unclassified Kribbella]|uniref:acyltransferase family protein n=1 Tax=unclassified Kribbella TaxID=2644121 RepID=UPI0030166771